MSKEFYKKSGKIFKQARIDKGLTQEQVAKHIKKNRPAYAQYERGVARIDAEIYIKLCDYLGLDLETVIKKASR